MLKMKYIAAILTIVVSQTAFSKEISKYPLDGNALDTGINQKNGQIIGDVTATSNRFNQAGKALKFTNGYINIPGYSGYNFFNKLSVSFWMRRDTGGTYIGLIGNGYTSRSVEIRMGRENNGSFMFARSDWSSGQTSVSSTNIIGIGTWHHIALVQDSGSSKLYIDGNLISQQTISHGNLAVLSQNLVMGQMLAH